LFAWDLKGTAIFLFVPLQRGKAKIVSLGLEEIGVSQSTERKSHPHMKINELKLKR
jgi:hypothetical protein